LERRRRDEEDWERNGKREREKGEGGESEITIRKKD
jgi:hypothetical protein